MSTSSPGASSSERATVFTAELGPFPPERVVHMGEPRLALDRERQVRDASVLPGAGSIDEPSLLGSLHQFCDRALCQRELLDEPGDRCRAVGAAGDLEEQQVLLRRDARIARRVLARAQEAPERRAELRGLRVRIGCHRHVFSPTAAVSAARSAASL